MSHARALVWLTAAMIGLAPAAMAQPPVDPEARINSRYLAGSNDTTRVEEIAVTMGRPAWWTVSQGKTRVHILGVPWVVPEGLGWSTRDLDAHLAKTPFIIVPPVVTASGDEIPISRLRIPDVGPIPEDLKSRLAVAAFRLGRPASRYTSVHPVLAGYLLATDFRQAIGMKEDRALQDVMAQLKVQRQGGHRVEAYYAGVAPAPKPRNVFQGLTAAGARACLESAIAEVEAGEEAARNAALAWRNGDVAGALNAPRSLDICAFASPALVERRVSGIKESSATITSVILWANGAAMTQAKKTGLTLRPELRVKSTDYVAVVNLRSLLAADGVLDRLAKEGFEITSPGSAPVPD